MKEIGRLFSNEIHQFFSFVGERISGSDFDKVLERMINSADPKIKDKIIAKITELYFQFGRGNSPKTALGRRSWHQWLEHGIEGEKAGFADFAPRWLDGFKISAFGKEYLKKSPGIFVTNHPTGPFRGVWVCFALNYVVEKKLGKDTGPFWFTHDFPQADSLLAKTSLRKLRERGTYIWASPGEVFIQPKDFEGREKILGEAVSHLHQGGRLAVTIENPNNRVLTKARPGVGKMLFKLTHQVKVPIFPVGMWREGDNLNLRFGPNFSIEGLSDYQKIANRVAFNIAKLLPEERRGIYGKL